MTLHKALHQSDDIDRRYVSRKERRGILSIEGRIDSGIQRLKDYVKKNEERSITVANNSINNIRGAYDKFPDFFRMGTFIDSTQMKL